MRGFGFLNDCQTITGQPQTRPSVIVRTFSSLSLFALRRCFGDSPSRRTDNSDSLFRSYHNGTVRMWRKRANAWLRKTHITGRSFYLWFVFHLLSLRRMLWFRYLQQTCGVIFVIRFCELLLRLFFGEGVEAGDSEVEGSGLSVSSRSESTSP